LHLRFLLLFNRSIKYLSVLPIIHSVLKSTLYIITENMLGDGSFSLSNFDRGKGKYSMSMDVYSLNYLNSLNKII
jgi:hypothetical protein